MAWRGLAGSLNPVVASALAFGLSHTMNQKNAGTISRIEFRANSTKQGIRENIGSVMRVEIDIPPKEKTVLSGCQVALARKGVVWRESCLGEKAKETGVYVIHHGGTIKYVGKTDGPSMSFGIRLRREFSEGASSGKHVFPKLASLAVPPPIMVSLFSSIEVQDFVHASDLSLSSYQAIEVFETVLIQAYRPEFQRHHINRTEAYVKKLGYTQPDDLKALLKAYERSPRATGKRDERN